MRCCFASPGPSSKVRKRSLEKDWVRSKMGSWSLHKDEHHRYFFSTELRPEHKKCYPPVLSSSVVTPMVLLRLAATLLVIFCSISVEVLQSISVLSMPQVFIAVKDQLYPLLLDSSLLQTQRSWVYCCSANNDANLSAGSCTGADHSTAAYFSGGLTP